MKMLAMRRENDQIFGSPTSNAINNNTISATNDTVTDNCCSSSSYQEDSRLNSVANPSGLEEYVDILQVQQLLLDLTPPTSTISTSNSCTSTSSATGVQRHRPRVNIQKAAEYSTTMVNTACPTSTPSAQLQGTQTNGDSPSRRLLLDYPSPYLYGNYHTSPTEDLVALWFGTNSSDSVGGTLDAPFALSKTGIAVSCVNNALSKINETIASASDPTPIFSAFFGNIADINSALEDIATSISKLADAADSITPDNGEADLFNVNGIDEALDEITAAEYKLCLPLNNVYDGKSNGGSGQDLSRTTLILVSVAGSKGKLYKAVHNLAGVPGTGLGLVTLLSGLPKSLRDVSKTLKELVSTSQSHPGPIDQSQLTDFTGGLGKVAQADSDLDEAVQHAAGSLLSGSENETVQ